MNQKIYIIVAVDEKNGMGKKDHLAWHFSKEIKYFKNLTLHTKDPSKKNALIMGRTTWESIPEKYRPLPGRENIVLTHQENYTAPGAKITHSLETAFNLIDENIETIFIIGGRTVFEEVINSPFLDGLYVTKINSTFDCDIYFPEIPEEFLHKRLLGAEEEKGIKIEYFLFTKT